VLSKYGANVTRTETTQIDNANDRRNSVFLSAEQTSLSLIGAGRGRQARHRPPPIRWIIEKNQNREDLKKIRVLMPN
jgi:hypothetical protein